MKKQKRKKIGIDARFYGPLGKGIGRYVQEVVDNVIKMDKKNDYVIFLYKDNFANFDDSAKNVKKVLINARWYTLAEQIKVPFYVFKERLDLMHFLHFNVPVLTPAKFIVTVHDLILTKFPTSRATTLGPLKYKIKNWGYKMVIWLAVKRAKKVIAVSEYTKKDLKEHFKLKDEKIEVTYEGISRVFRQKNKKIVDNDSILKKYKIKKPFLLYVGNAYPHKNLEGLIEVFTEIHKKRKDLQLVLVGKEDYFYRRVKNFAKDKGMWDEQKEQNPIVFSDYVPDDDLEVLFKQALAYIFPSFFEGFGLPPLEAMSRGCPVASSDKTCLPEILGDAAVYFNPDNKEEMQRKIEEVIHSESLRKKLIEKGHRQFRKYSWKRCASQTLKIYKKYLFNRG